MAEKYPDFIRQFGESSENYVKKLIGIWFTMFDENLLKEYFDKLTQHVNDFYGELIEQSLSQRSDMQKCIDELNKRGEVLSRLLKIESYFPRYQHEEMPLNTILYELEGKVENLDEKAQEKRQEISKLLAEQKVLCDQLDMSPRILLCDPLPTASDIEDFRKHLENLSNEKQKLSEKLSIMRSDVQNFLNILNLKLHTDIENRLVYSCDINISKQTFVGLQRMYDLYSVQVKELKSTIDDMREKLETLWNYLNTSLNTRIKFRLYTEYNRSTYDALYNELQRCEAVKRENINIYLRQLRAEIHKWWDKTLKSEKQRNRFLNFRSSCYTDDLLQLHELELEDLKFFYESNRCIFELYAERNMFWQRMQDLEAKAFEPGRFNNRGGQLLKEEKERKTLSIKLPKIEQQIRGLVRAFEDRESSPFLVHGKNIIEVMNDQWEEKRLEKEKLLTVVKNAGKTNILKSKANCVIPNSSNAKRTLPISKYAGSTLALKETPLKGNNLLPKSTNLLHKTPLKSTNRRYETPSAVDVLTAPHKVNSQKRKLTKSCPKHVFDNPCVSIKPTSSNKIISNAIKAIETENKFDSSLNTKRIISCTPTGRKGAIFKKRLSISKNNSKTIITEAIIDNGIECVNDVIKELDKGAYDAFNKCINGSNRSFTLENSAVTTDLVYIKRTHKLFINGSKRLEKRGTYVKLTTKNGKEK
uniref:Protein regulator of cytokinesis 1 n=1 Tax=Glossina brevipalpis TaxID=37001 RepID=A0A1A9X4E5_9MUSC